MRRGPTLDPKRMSFEPCTSALNSARIHRQSFALVRDSLGVNRVNHIFRVYGRTILTEETAATTFDEVGLGSPRFYRRSCAQQATLSAGRSGARC